MASLYFWFVDRFLRLESDELDAELLPKSTGAPVEAYTPSTPEALASNR
jgi:hypothetical protein